MGKNKLEFSGGKEIRAFFLDRPALLPAGSAGIGWRFAESHILGLPAADAQEKAVQRKLAFVAVKAANAR